MPTDSKPPPILRKRSERSSILTVHTSNSNNNNNNNDTSGSSSAMDYTAVVAAAKDKASSVVHSARAWLTPSSEWTSSLTQLESLSTVMFSPLAAHPVYRSESMVKALQLMQQQQQRQHTPNASNALAAPRDLVLHGKMYAWPSSAVLLQADIPETNNPVSLFQGFASAYPSLASSSSSRSPKRNRAKKKKQQQQQQQQQHRQSKDVPRSLTQIISEREKRVRDCDRISMQKSSTANEIDQINLQINELLSKRQTLEQKWEKLEAKDMQLQLMIDDLNDAIMDIEEGGSGRALLKSERGDSDEDSDEDEVEPGTCFKTLEGHTDDVVCVDFNHPKGMLVSSSMDGSVKAWDLYRNRCLGNLEGHTGVVRCLHLNEARLLTGADDHTIKQWDLSLIPPSFDSFSSTPSSPSLTATDGGGGIVSETFTLEGHQGEITALDASQSSVVSGSNDKTIRQWDLETQQCVLTLDVMWASKNGGGGIVDSWLDTAINYGYAAHDFVGALQFWDFALASGTSDGKIRMWDLRTGQAHRTLPGHSAPITCLQFDQVHLVSGSLDKTIRIWDLRTGSVFDTLTYTASVSSLQFDASKIISAGTSSSSSSIDVYNRTSFQHSALAGHKQHVNSIRFRNSVLASGGSDHLIKLWSI
ncbi:hypothetical protein MBANPS3_011431 [Mucor bainieri]